jgi:hypothetical protein
MRKLDLTDLPQDRDQYWALVKAATDEVVQKLETHLATVALERKSL